MLLLLRRYLKNTQNNTKRLFSVANVFNLNENILKNRFSKPFVSPESPDSKSSAITDGLMLKHIMHKELLRLDIHKRSLYFRVRNPDAPDWEVPKGADLLVLNPGSWIKIYYKNNHEAPNLSTFGGVLVSVHENYQSGKFKVLGAVGGVAVLMEFMVYSPLIEKIEIYFRSIPTRTMEYLWDGPISNLKGPVDSTEQTEIAPAKDMQAKNHQTATRKKIIKQPEVISRETANLTIEERLAGIYPMEVPKGYDKFRDMSEVERYTEKLFSE